MHILTVNSGSSSLKACVFLDDGERQHFRFPLTPNTVESGLSAALNSLKNELAHLRIDVIGHRFVHGGDCPDAARLLTPEEFHRLESIAHLAPLHMESNLHGARFCQNVFEVPQIACFDTAFHHTLPESAWRLPIPNEYGLRRFGFHGLNYAHIARKLPELLGEISYNNVLIAHLGSGASLCCLQNLQSVATTMGYTPAGGIPMAIRSGDLDPGVMLELMKKVGTDELIELTYHRMGLLALSQGESSDIAELLKSDSANARFAVQYFCAQARAAIGAYAAQLGGLNAIVFTAGIGEHSSIIREKIIEPLGFMNFALDAQANEKHSTLLSTQHSKPILMIPADEEAEIAYWVEKLNSSRFT
ncbi:MAG: acetate kinase [Nitrosomonas sp.]|nr:acetate kinase [Nitrosomonas sp.]